MTPLLILCAAVFAADSFDAEFRAGNAAFDAGDYSAAIQAYERLIASGAADPEVFYNLGNAFYRAGRPGPAIVNYERALALAPGFTEAQENLEIAVMATEARLPRPLRPAWQQALLFWDVSLTYETARRLAITAWIAAWGALALLLVRPFRFLRPIALLFLGLALLSGLSAWCKAHPPALAVGVAASAPVRYGNSELDPMRFELREGDRVAVEAQLDGWTRVRSVDNVRGWVRDEQIFLVGPPYAPAPAPTTGDPA